MNNRILSRNRTRLVVLLAVLLLLMSGCHSNKIEETGEPAYIFDVRLINNTLYWIGRFDDAFELHSGNIDQSVLVKSFPEDTLVVFCEDKVCYYYLDAGVLAAYSPVTDQVSTICESLEGSLMCAARDYCLLSTETKTLLVNTQNGEVLPAENMPSGFFKILDMLGNTIVLWNHDQQTICEYDCEKDSLTVLYTRERTASSVMVTAILYGDSLYFAETQGGFRKIPTRMPYELPVTVSANKIIATERTDHGLILAAKNGSDIHFYWMSEEEELTEFAVWQDAGYIVPGSCLLCASEDKIACAVTSEWAIFEADLPSF